MISKKLAHGALCDELHKAGAPEDTEYCWTVIEYGFYYPRKLNEVAPEDIVCPAYTIEQLTTWVPQLLPNVTGNYQLEVEGVGISWRAYYREGNHIFEETVVTAMTEADLYVSMILRLLELKLINIEELHY